MVAKYLIRLDDASEYMDYNKWDKYFKIFDKYNIKPIIAVIPFNKDPKLINNNPDKNFWDKVRNWQKNGYLIGMHGYEHVYLTNQSGIIGLNNKSEFAGVPVEKQIKMISRAYEKFKKECIDVKIFVAPAHSFDYNTLFVLKNYTNIEYISDGFFVNPLILYGFKWIPQQLWKPKLKINGIWTICYHPESDNEEKFEILSKFIQNNNSLFIDL